MKTDRRLWGIVLAAGEGTRVRSLTTNQDGRVVPKQFWTHEGRPSLLRRTLTRVRRRISANQVLVVVAARHACWWSRQLGDVPPENLIIQPENRGTAAGTLLPLMQILRRDPDAMVAVFPCDHHFENESVFEDALAGALTVAQAAAKRVVVLGMPAEEYDDEYGWILPLYPAGGGVSRRVESIVEKPDRETAERLMHKGAVVNSLILVATAKALAEMFSLTLPAVVRQFVAWRDANGSDGVGLTALYGQIPPCDLTVDLLQRNTDALSVLFVPDCGWADVGTPGRFQRFEGAPVKRVAVKARMSG